MAQQISYQSAKRGGKMTSFTKIWINWHHKHFLNVLFSYFSNTARHFGIVAWHLEQVIVWQCQARLLHTSQTRHTMLQKVHLPEGCERRLRRFWDHLQVKWDGRAVINTQQFVTDQLSLRVDENSIMKANTSLICPTYLWKEICSRIGIPYLELFSWNRRKIHKKPPTQNKQINNLVNNS